jgi:hypothetical protein
VGSGGLAIDSMTEPSRDPCVWPATRLSPVQCTHRATPRVVIQLRGIASKNKHRHLHRGGTDMALIPAPTAAPTVTNATAAADIRPESKLSALQQLL